MGKLPKFNELNTCHFITTKVWQNIWLFKEEKYCQIIIDNLEFYCKKYDFKLIAYAIIPWHLHLILMLSNKFNNISKVMQDFKKFTAVQMIQQLIKDKKEDLLQKFSLTGEIESYPSALGKAQTGSKASALSGSARRDPTVPVEELDFISQPGRPRSSDRGNATRAGSEDPAIPVGEAQGTPRSLDRGKVHIKRRKYQIWLPDNYDFNIYSYQRLEQKVDYVNNNPVKHGLVSDPVNYKFSSAINYYLNDHSIIKIDQLDL